MWQPLQFSTTAMADAAIQFSSIALDNSIYYVEEMLYNQNEIIRTDCLFLLSSGGDFKTTKTASAQKSASPQQQAERIGN